ncbi:hypothetical protein LJC32_05950 [Oscillospiraceae bacterium OttesenSCG-928-F05]|nr:hypothetical protein [Oscillospiraceae bacterium OttesenSCG-928-F05]
MYFRGAGGLGKAHACTVFDGGGCLPPRPCGLCAGCHKAEGGIHPDVTAVGGEGDIHVDAARALRRELFVRAGEAPRRVVIIDGAERMNLSAQNALLQVLEDPPSDVLFLLITENSAELLETVRSRAAVLRLSPVPEAAMADHLRARFPEAGAPAVHAAVAASGGATGKAISYLEGGGGATEGHLFYEVFCGAGDRARAEAQFLAKMDKMKRADCEGFFTSLTEDLAAALKKHAEAGTPLPGGLSADKALKLVALCGDMLERCRFNAGPGHMGGTFVVACEAILAGAAGP